MDLKHKEIELSYLKTLSKEDIARMLNKGEGVKHDENKSRVDLIPPEAIFAMGDIMGFAAQAKYEPRNWEKGMAWGRVFGSAMRHLWAWWAGVKQDPESKKSHLWHALCCVAFLVAYEQRNVGQDDRPTSKKL